MIFYDYFDPAFRAGGPIRSIVNLVKLLSGQFTFYVVTGDQDHDGTRIYDVPNQWINYQENVQVIYLDTQHRSTSELKKIVENVMPDCLHINGFLSFFTTVSPLRIAQKLNLPVLISPRGMLQQQALAIKAWKKKIYLVGMKLLYLHRGICWHLTTPPEEEDFKALLPQFSERIQRVGNVPNYSPDGQVREARSNPPVFGCVALISPLKNIDKVILALSEIDRPLEYRLYGPIKDKAYWQKCRHLATELPTRISFKYFGELPPQEVPEVISSLDFYVQPSGSENFGHSIFEAFNAGVPVITSHGTPWNGLEERRAGWNCSTDTEGIKWAIDEALSLKDNIYADYSRAARNEAVRYMESANLKAQYVSLYQSVIGN